MIEQMIKIVEDITNNFAKFKNNLTFTYYNAVSYCNNTEQQTLIEENSHIFTSFIIFYISYN